MIKTMLLTAQLALSPIVGTNGLQPKCLPNPVYGESVDYSITYNGETYTRLAYLNKETNWKISGLTPDDWAYITFAYQGLMTQGEASLQANVGSGEEGTYFTMFYIDTEGWIMEDTAQKVCFSYYGRTMPTTYYYVEVFITDSETYEIHYFKLNNETNIWETTQSGGDFNTYKFENLSNKTMANNPVCTLGNIPQTQPTTANPSVYDNIYNFYYQNLFANEALDELGAEVGNNSLTMRQWLAHTATIVSISLLAVALAVLVIKIFKLIAGSISDIWG